MSESATAESLRSGLKALNVPPQVLSRMWADTGSHLQQNGSTVDIDGASYDAMNCFVNAVLVQPTNVDAWRAIGDALQQRGDSRDDGDDSDEEDESDGDSPPAEVTIAGVTYTVVEARAKAVECEPKAVDLWLALGNALHANRTVVVSGKQVNALLCFASALTLDVAQPEAWFFCGEELAKRGASETCEILGKKYAAWQCAVEGLKRDPKGYPPAWLDLAKTLPKDMKTVLVGNARGHLSRTECVVTALQLDPENADAWQSLGLLLCEARLEGASDTATIDDVKVVAHDCFIRALELDPTLHDSWVALGNQLRLAGDEAQCTVASVDCSAVTCFAAALRLDEQNAAAWRGLAGALDSRETTVELKIESSPEPFEATPYSCLLRALELCPTEGTAWLDLARAMPTGGSATVGEWQRSQIDCFAEACHLAPEEADCWFALGEALPTGGVVKVGERVFGQLRAFTECLRCDPKCAVAWANVGALMVPGTKSVVFEGDEGLSQVDCYVRALRIEPDNKSVWKLLGNALKGANTTADVFGDGKPLSYDDCVTKVGTL